MKTFNPIQYNDHDKAFAQIRKQVNTVLDLFISVGLDYIDKIAGTLNVDDLFLLRDSASFRLQGRPLRSFLPGTSNFPDAREL